MRKSGWRILRTFFVILAGAIAVTACGGGGGSSSGGSSAVTYSGNTQAAVIDGTTAEGIALDAYAGGELQAGMGIVPTDAAMGSLALADTLSASLATQDFAQTSSLSAAAQSQTMPGDCGGWMTQAISSDANGNFNGSMNFVNYCSAGTTINGGVSFSGAYDMQANRMSFTLQFNSLTTSMEGESFTSSGSMAMNISMDMTNLSPQTYTMNMVVTDPLSGEEVWLKDYTMTVTPGSGSDQVTITGKYYDYQLGYVDISTVQGIQISEFDGFPQSGELRFDGAAETWAILSFTGGGGYQVEASDGTIIAGLL